MADLFTHVLVGFVVAVVLSWRYDWLTYPFVAVVMLGAALPDLNRLEFLVPSSTVYSLLGVPFSWVPIHRAGGTLLVVCIGALLAPKQYRRAVFALLFIGAASHYLLDAFLYRPSGVTGPLLWPFVTDGFSVEGFYLSTDRWPAALATAVAGVVWFVNRSRMDVEPDSGRPPEAN